MGVACGILGSAGCQPVFVGSLPTKSCSASCRTPQASCLRSPDTTAGLNFNVRAHYGAGGDGAMSVASARCFGRGQIKARIPSNHVVANGTSPGIQIA